MSTFHPIITHFPIALLSIAFFFQLIQLWKPYWICRVSPLWLLGISVLSSIISDITGESAAVSADAHMQLQSETIDLIQKHETIANLTTFISLLFFIVWLWLFLSKMSDIRVDYLAVVFLLFVTILVLITGHTGGELVFEHNVGVGY